MRIILSSNVDVYYASFYIKGLIDLFGKKTIVFDAKPFSKIKNGDSNLNIIVQNNGLERKISIQYNDTFEIHDECYEWCDVYGSVNANWNETPDAFKPKLVSLAPSFGIRLWNLSDTIYYAISNYLKQETKTSFKKFIGKYKRQYILRLPLNEYSQKKTIDNYIFHVSTLWQSDEYVMNDEFVNRIRAIFIETCKSINEIQFEGGFYYNGKHTLNQRFSHLIFNNFMPVKEYMQKLQQSVLVFNTPAWLNCNGWKLAEYMALGKAIISTPILNNLPESLVHGENIHFVSDKPEEMKEAILLICRDKIYRDKIAKGAYNYYLRNATPVRSLALLGISNNMRFK